MGYRPKQPARRPNPKPPGPRRSEPAHDVHMHFEARPDMDIVEPRAEARPSAVQTLLPDVWEATRDVVVQRTKVGVGVTVASVGVFAANGGAPDTIVGIMMTIAMVLIYGVIGHQYVANRKASHTDEALGDLAAPTPDSTGFMGYADAAPSIEDDLAATARKIATPCKCGSEAPAVPVDVAFDSAHTIAVAHLCPDCREPRTEKQLRVEAERMRRAEQSVARVLQAQSTDVPTPASSPTSATSRWPPTSRRSWSATRRSPRSRAPTTTCSPR